jgi:hypothetical protein
LFPESLLNLQDGKHLKSFSPGMRRKMTEMWTSSLTLLLDRL